MVSHNIYSCVIRVHIKVCVEKVCVWAAASSMKKTKTPRCVVVDDQKSESLRVSSFSKGNAAHAFPIHVFTFWAGGIDFSQSASRRSDPSRKLRHCSTVVRVFISVASGQSPEKVLVLFSFLSRWRTMRSSRRPLSVGLRRGRRPSVDIASSSIAAKTRCGLHTATVNRAKAERQPFSFTRFFFFFF